MGRVLRPLRGRDGVSIDVVVVVRRVVRGVRDGVGMSVLRMGVLRAVRFANLIASGVTRDDGDGLREARFRRVSWL